MTPQDIWKTVSQAQAPRKRTRATTWSAVYSILPRRMLGPLIRLLDVFGYVSLEREVQRGLTAAINAGSIRDFKKRIRRAVAPVEGPLRQVILSSASGDHTNLVTQQIARTHEVLPPLQTTPDRLRHFVATIRSLEATGNHRYAISFRETICQAFGLQYVWDPSTRQASRRRVSDDAKPITTISPHVVVGEAYEFDLLRHEILLAMSGATEWQTAGPADSLFRSLIEDRCVTLIGPAPIDADLRLPADEVVVVMKPLERRLAISAHVGYLNASDLPLWSSRHDQGVAQEVDLLCVKKGSHRQLVGSTMMRPVPTRVPMLLGPPNSGTIAIWDLLLARPRRLRVLGMDLYAGAVIYNDELRRTYEQSQRWYPHLNAYDASKNYWAKLRADNFLAHDNLSDFMLLKSLRFVRSNFEPTGVLADVLSMPLTEYSERLDRTIHGSDNQTSWPPI